MSYRSSRTPFAATVLALSLFVLPVAGEAASWSRLRLPQTGELRIMQRLERALVQSLVSFWQKAGARIDDNGKS